MSDTVDIGAARVRLIVDAADFQPVIDQGKNAIRAFGQEAQQTYDKTEKGTRRAADALLDYVSGLGRADTTMDRFLRNASRIGVEKPVLDAAIEAWGKHNDKVEQAAIAQDEQANAVKRSQAAYKDLISTQQAAEAQAQRLANAQAAERIENLAAARAATAQQAINGQLGVTDGSADMQRRADAEAAFLPLLEQEAESQAHLAAEVKRSQTAYKELLATQQQEEAQLRASANAAAEFRIQLLAQERAATSQRDVNALVAPGLDTNSFTQADRRKDAEEAFAGIVEKENDEFARQLALTEAIATARGDQHAINVQQDFNKLLGIPDQQRALQLAEQRRNAESAFAPILEAEADAQAKLNAQRSAGDSFIKQLENTQQAAGKTYYELLRIKAAELGISDQAKPLIQRLEDTNKALGAGTISAKQYEFAVRGLPAQFTDVFVSLAAGQNPLTVLLQQGGQVKDMFGGIKTAVGAVGKELGKIVTNPWLLLATAIAAAGAAAYETTQRVTQLAIASAKGNGVAGTAQQLSVLSKQLTMLHDINLNQADASVKGLAESGVLVGKNFQLAAEATARWATITGESTDDVSRKFEEVARDPLQALLSGVLKVTDAQYAQLVALERVGDKTGAAALAVKLYYDQVNNNSKAVQDNLSTFANIWIDIKGNIEGAVEAFGKFVTKSTDDRLTKLASFINNPTWQGFLGRENPADSLEGAFSPHTGTMPTGLGGPKTPVALTHDQIEDNNNLQKSYDELGTKQQIYATDLLKLQANIRGATQAKRDDLKITMSQLGVLSGPGYDKLVAGLHLKVFGEGPDPTKEIKAWEKTALDAIKTTQTAADIAFADQQLSAEQYYKVAAQLARDDAQIELLSIDKQRDALKLRANSDDARAALLQQRQTVVNQLNATELKLTHDGEVAVRARTTAYHDYVQALADANIALSRQGDQQARAVGIGDRQAALLNAQDNARQAEALAERAAQDKADAAGGGAEAQKKADADKEAAAAALSTQLDILKGNYDSLAVAESSWLNGSIKAWQNWSAEVQNQAAEAGKVFGIVMNDISTDIVDAALKGHLSFKNLLSDLLKEITEFGAKQALLLAATSAGFNTGKPGTGGSNGTGDLLGGLAGLLAGSAGTSSTAASGLSGLTSLFSGSFGGGFFAKGGAFAGGSGLEAHRNAIVSSPTYFPFAKGGVPNVGLMGEKPGSPGEAIMPLTRTSGGDLGVKVTGQQPQRTFNNTQVFVVPGAVDRQTQSQLAIKQGAAASRAARRT